MVKQLVYEWRGRGLTRGLALGIFLAITLFFLLVGGATGRFVSIPIVPGIGVLLSGIGFVALLVVATVLAIESCNKLFGKPYAYFTMLTPARGWQIVGSRLLIALTDYAVALIVGLGMVALQVHVLLNVTSWVEVTTTVRMPTAEEIKMVAAVVVSILRFLMLFYFARTMMHSVYAGLSVRVLLGILTFIAANAVWSLTERFLPFSGTASLGGGVVSLVSYVVLSAVRLAALFVPTAILLEKRINL